MLANDITGLKFGEWSVLEKDSIKNKHAQWLCQCSCGATSVVDGTSLRTGKSTSCGCKKAKLISKSKVTHGLSYTKEYQAWENMKARCLDVKHKSYKDYGGRGIKVYEPWINDVAAFVSYVGKAPSPKHQIDRFPNNKTGNYEPGNVVWRTASENSRNRRSNAMFFYNGANRCLTVCAELSGISAQTIWMRRELGWTDAAIFSTPVASRKERYLSYSDPITNIVREVTFAEAARLTNQSQNAITSKFDAGCSLEVILSNVKRPRKNIIRVEV